MSIFSKLKKLFFGKDKKNTNSNKDNYSNDSNYHNYKPKNQSNEIKTENTQNIGQQSTDYEEKEYYLEDLWNYIDPNKNTQAYHILSVIGFDEWVNMDEIRERIKSMFFIEYKHEKSLYPYIKTLTDLGLLENTSIGGKRKWKKKEIIIKLKPKALINIENKNKIKNKI